MPRPYDRTLYDGHVVDWLTRAALTEAAARLKYDDGLTITQGSYNAGGVSSSAGTHDGGGVVDLAPFEPTRKVTVLRQLGFAAWYRPELWRDGVRVWPAHIHAVLIGNRRLSSAARAQVAEYLAGYDGLAGAGRDPGPRQYVDRRFRWRTGGRRITRAASALARARALLSTGIRGHRVQPALRALRRVRDVLPKVKTP